MPGKATDPGVTAADSRQFPGAALRRFRAGSPRRGLPERFGKWNSVFKRFRRWALKGVFERVFNALSDGSDLERVSVDGTVVRAPDGFGGNGGTKRQGIGRSRGGLTGRTAAVTDALGCPVRFVILPGQAHGPARDAGAPWTISRSAHLLHTEPPVVRRRCFVSLLLPGPDLGDHRLLFRNPPGKAPLGQGAISGTL